MIRPVSCFRKEYATVWKNNTEAVECPAESPRDVLTEVLRQGAQQMLAVAILAEADAYVEAHNHLLDEDGHRLVVRNGYLPRRAILTGLGQVEVQQPRVRDRRPPEEREATECLVKDRDVLLTSYDFPAEHWVHLRTTNPVESTFATVRLRPRRTKGCGSRVRSSVHRRSAKGRRLTMRCQTQHLTISRARLRLTIA